ncbi:MAG: DNA-3-methyladenine glycosylase 2 family protein [Chitinophagaceae bacterium]|nr:DNA-3-methyladenine glycosylase 2 family protein [Chitinophagaceae bacterium]
MNYRSHLLKDKKLAAVIKQLPEVKIEKRNKIYLRLCSSILSQQLSVHVARTLYGRFLGLYGNREPRLEEILNTPVEDLKEIGFSRAKCSYVQNVCNFFAENNISDKSLHAMDDEEVIKLLTQIKGVGRWTAEMILMFSLGREDVFALDDLGIRNAMIRIYNIREQDKKKLNDKLIRISGKWSPYRTYACRYLWMSKDMGIVVS